MVTMVGCDDAWLCQDEEDTDMLSVFPSSPTGFYRQRNSTNHSNPPQEMSPGSVQISCAANPPPAAQGAGNDERGDSSGSMCEIVAGALSTNTAVLCSPPRQLPRTGSFGDSRGWALDYYQHMSPCFLFVSQSPPRAQSQTLSDSVDYIGVGGLCNFDDDGHTGTLGISTCTASTNLDVAAGRQQLTGSGENVSDLRLEDKCLNPFDEGLRREVALDIGELKGSFLASAKRGRRLSSAVWLHFVKADNMRIKADNMRIARCILCYAVLKADSKINGGARSDALKRHQSLSFPEPERGKKKECVENPMQVSISPKCIESKHADIGPGHVSENQIQGTTKSKSEVGLHFTKEVHGQGSGIVKAKCQQCKSVQGDVLERHQSLCFLELEKGTKKQFTENSMLQGSDRNQYIDSSKHLEVAPGAVSGKQVEGTSSGNSNRVKRGPKRAAVGSRRQVVEGTRRLRSHVWKLFTIEFLVNNNGSQTKMGRCIYCDTLLKADSTKNGTSRLWKHIKEFHKIRKHVNEENKTNEEIEPGDVSRKSEAWDHFTMGVDVEGSSIVKAMCRHCDNLFKVDSTTNDTCILRHITEFHRIKLRKHFNEEKSRNDGALSDPGQRRVRHISSETKSLLKRSAKQIVVTHNKRKRATCEGIEKQDYICTKSELKLLKTVMKKPLDGEELLVDISRTECLTRKELDCLFQKRGKEAYLNNEVMNAYIALLNSNKKLLHRNDESIVLETTFLHALLKRDAFLNDQMNSFSSMEENNGKRRICNMVVSYLNNDMIFLPINVAEKHWYLGVINAKKKCIQILDSCGTAFGRTDLEATIKGLQKYIVMVSGWEQLESDKWPDFKVASWPQEEIELGSCVQTDDCSCGLFVLNYMKYWTGTNLTAEFTQEDMTHFRLKLAYILLTTEMNKAVWGQSSNEDDNMDSSNLDDVAFIETIMRRRLQMEQDCRLGKKNKRGKALRIAYEENKGKQPKLEEPSGTPLVQSLEQPGNFIAPELKESVWTSNPDGGAIGAVTLDQAPVPNRPGNPEVPRLREGPSGTLSAADAPALKRPREATPPSATFADPTHKKPRDDGHLIASSPFVTPRSPEKVAGSSRRRRRSDREPVLEAPPEAVECWTLAEVEGPSKEHLPPPSPFPLPAGVAVASHLPPTSRILQEREGFVRRQDELHATFPSGPAATRQSIPSVTGPHEAAQTFVLGSMMGTTPPVAPITPSRGGAAVLAMSELPLVPSVGPSPLDGVQAGSGPQVDHALLHESGAQACARVAALRDKFSAEMSCVANEIFTRLSQASDEREFALSQLAIAREEASCAVAEARKARGEADAAKAKIVAMRNELNWAQGAAELAESNRSRAERHLAQALSDLDLARRQLTDLAARLEASQADSARCLEERTLMVSQVADLVARRRESEEKFCEATRLLGLESRRREQVEAELMRFQEVGTRVVDFVLGSSSVSAASSLERLEEASARLAIRFGAIAESGAHLGAVEALAVVRSHYHWLDLSRAEEGYAAGCSDGVIEAILAEVEPVGQKMAMMVDPEAVLRRAEDPSGAPSVAKPSDSTHDNMEEQ